MLQDWKYRLTTGWSLMRVVRLALSVILMIQAWTNSEILFAVLGGVLLFQAVFNYGCCSSAGCSVDYRKKQNSFDNKKIEEVQFKEIK